MENAVTFRKDINGLRAFAVIGVVAFHFYPQLIPGGFSGVDVFFVISGFLMTSIIFNRLKDNRFSLPDFYQARINRIVPELLTVCGVLLIAGFFFVTPMAYRLLAKHALASVTFLSNFVYTFEQGYFDVASHDKWLLHTWSLSTEWQFYLVYPLAILALMKCTGRSVQKTALALVILTLASLFFSVFTSTIWPGAAYFGLPWRFWELGLGGLAFLYPWNLGKRQVMYATWSGMLLIGLSFFLITEQDVYPGYLAIFPVLGAFLLIQARNERNPATNNLFCQKIGEWSYSIYLWHYPLVVVVFSFSLSAYWKIPLMLGSVLLGYLSNAYIARKRTDKAVSRSVRSYQPLLASICVVSILAFYSDVFAKLKLRDDQSLVLYKELLQVKPETLAKYNLNHTDFRKTYVKGSTCSFDKQMPPQYAFECVMNIIGDEGWLVIGDSHGRDFYHSLEIAYPDKHIAMLQQSSCAPAKSVKQNSKIMCFQDMDKIIEFINTNEHIKKVVFAARYTEEAGTANFLRQLGSGQYKRDLIVVNSGLHLDRDFSNYLYKYGAQEYYPMETGFVAQKHQINAELAGIQRSNIKIFDKYHAFCNANDECKLTNESRVLYIDNQHLSEKGMTYLAAKIKQSRIMEL